MFSTWLRKLNRSFRKSGPKPGLASRRQSSYFPHLDALEDRWCPAGNTYIWYYDPLASSWGSWTDPSNWVVNGQQATSYPGQYGIGTPDTAVFVGNVGPCAVPSSTTIDIACLKGAASLGSYFKLLLKSNSVLAVVGGGNDGYWDSLQPVGTDLGGVLYSNDTGELYIGGGSSTSQASFELDGWINDASTTTYRGKFVIGPYTTLNIKGDTTNGIYPNIGASMYVGYDSSLNMANQNALVSQKFDVTINNGANVSTAVNSQWEVTTWAFVRIQSGVTPGTFGNYGSYVVDDGGVSNESLPFYNSYRGGTSGVVTVGAGSLLEFGTTFSADNQTCCYEQTGSDSNGSAHTYLKSGASFGTGTGHSSDRLDIKDGGVELQGSGGQSATVKGTLWMNGASAKIDLRCTTNAFTLNYLTCDWLVWSVTGKLYTSVNYPAGQADYIKVYNTATLNDGGSNNGDVQVTKYGTQNNAAITIVDAGTLNGLFASISQPFRQSANGGKLQITWPL